VAKEAAPAIPTPRPFISPRLRWTLRIAVVINAPGLGGKDSRDPTAGRITSDATDPELPMGVPSTAREFLAHGYVRQ